MRTISAAAQAILTSGRKIEPIIAIDVQWTIGGKWYQYAEKELVNGSGRTIKGIINQVAGLDNVIVIQSVMTGQAGDSQNLSLTLDDTSGELKQIVMNNDVHKRTVKVYLYLDGTTFDTDRIWLFTGELSTPIEWDEGTRTLTINVINKIEDAEVGFSIEEGDFYLPPQELIGKAWPLCFGRCIHIPALRVKDPVRGILKTGFGIADFILPHLAKQIKAVCCPMEFAGFKAVQGPPPYYSLEIYATYRENASCYCKRQGDSELALAQYLEQKQYEYEELTISGGKQFPQGKRIWLQADGAKIYGYFSGEKFTVLKHVHPKVDEIEVPEYKYGWNLCSNPANSLGGGLFRTFPKPSFNAPANCDGSNAATENTGWDYVASYPRADFFWVQPGTEVYQIDSDGDSVHVVNLLPSSIQRVAAWKQYDLGLRELSTVPKSYYTKRVSNFNGYLVQEVVLKKPLRFYDEGWEGDEIYVSLNSSVGPNMVDEMIWLINKYTDLSYDAANFAAVKSKLSVYRNNYPILERKNIIEVLRTMAFNNRCALILRDNQFKLVYLSDTPTPVMTITESDIVPQTLKIGHTNTEDLVTKVNGVWRDDYAYAEKKYVCRYNVKKYGTMEETFEFPCFNIYQWVVKSNTFWMIRMANTWKRLKFQTYMDKIALEVLDCIEVNLPDFCSVPVKCIVENATYDSANNTIEIECWTPVRAGEDFPNEFPHPAGIRVDRYWPTADDIKSGFAGGSGPNVEVTAPAMHPLARPIGITGFNMKDDPDRGPCDSTSTNFKPVGCRPDHGDTQPSDIDDQNVDVKSPGEENTGEEPDAKGGYGLIQNQFTELKQQEEQKQEDQSGQIQKGTDVQTGEGDKTPEPGNNEWCDDMGTPEDNGWDRDDMPDCLVAVHVGYLRPVNRVYKYVDGQLTTSSKAGDMGQAINDQPEAAFNANVYWFNSYAAAKAFHDQIKQMACSWNAIVGAIWPACGAIWMDTYADGTWAFGQHDNGKQSGNPTGENCKEPDDPGMVAKDESKGGGSTKKIPGGTGLCDSLQVGEHGFNGSTMDWINPSGAG